MTTLSLTFGYLVCAFLGMLEMLIIWSILTGRIDISKLLSDVEGGASMSRLQLLIFTIVIATGLAGLLVTHVNPGVYPDVPRGVLILLAMSASTFLISKRISNSRRDVVLENSQNQSPATADPLPRGHSQSQGWVPLAAVLAAVGFLGVLAMVGFLGLAVYRHDISALLAALLAFGGGLTAWFLVLFLQAVNTDGPPHFETNWGGLGGGIGGWRFSTSLIYLMCSFVGGAVVLVAFLAK